MVRCGEKGFGYQTFIPVGVPKVPTHAIHAHLTGVGKDSTA